MLLAKELFIKSQLIGCHWFALTLHVPTPRARLPVNNVILTIGCLDDKVNETLEITCELKLRYWLIKRFFGRVYLIAREEFLKGRKDLVEDLTALFTHIDDHFIIRFAHFGLPVPERAIWTNLYHGIA